MFENSLIVVNIKLDNARWFLRGLNKPFDPFAQKAMHDTMIGISNTRCCVSSDDERKGNEKVPKNKDRTMGRFSVVEYGLYHMYIQTSTKAILRNGVTEDDLKLLIQTILHMFDDDMSSVRPSMTVRKVVVARQNRNSGRVRPTDIEDAMVAKLKPGVNNPTSFNDYDLEFKRDMLPDSVEVKEYTMDNPEGVIL